jgi:hypothetical protein
MLHNIDRRRLDIDQGVRLRTFGRGSAFTTCGAKKTASISIMNFISMLIDQVFLPERSITRESSASYHHVSIRRAKIRLQVTVTNGADETETRLATTATEQTQEYVR